MKPFLLSLSLFFSLAAHAQTKITVRVTDTNRAPVAGAGIETQIWRDRSKPIPPQTTDATGTATLELPNSEDGKPLQASISVVAPGFAFNNAALDGKDLEVRLEPGATWRGKITDEAGKAIVGAEVRVTMAIPGTDYSEQIRPFGEKNLALYTTKSGADGSFEIKDVPAKMGLQISIRHPNYVAKNQGQVLPDAEASFKLAPGGALRGRVVDVEGKPLANVMVYASSSRFSGGNSGTTDKDGNFTVGSLAAGVYSLITYLETAEKDAEFVLPRATGVVVEVGKTGDAPEMRAVKGVTIATLVRDAATKKPLVGATVIAQDGNETAGYGATDKDGKTALRVLPGRYKIYISGPPQGYVRPEEQQSADAGEVAGQTITFDLKPATVLRGLIVDETGKPLQAKIKVDYDSSIESDAKGEWKYEPQTNRKLQLAGGDGDDGYFEIVSPKVIELNQTAPTTITVRKKPWIQLTGRALASDGKTLEGVQIEGSFYVPTGDDGSLSSSQRSAKSGVNGEWVLPQIREGVQTSYFNIKGKKDGFAFQKGGEVSKNGAVLQVADLVFVPLNLSLAGTTTPGARVTAAGLETVAGADGSFKFTGLPASEDKVWAFKGAEFGGAAPKSPLQIELKTQGIQPRDAELARDIWSDIVAESQRGTKGRAYYGMSSIERYLAKDGDAAPDFAAQLEKATGDQGIAAAGERAAGKVDFAALETAFGRIKNGDTRAYAYLGAAAKTPDDKTLAPRALQEAEASFKSPDKESWWRETNLYRAIPIAVQVGGQAAGFSALDRAVAYTLKNHGEKSTRTGGRHTAGRDEMMATSAELVAPAGLPLVRRLLENIEPGLGYDVMALGNAIPVLAKNDPESALTLLDELQKMPEPAKTEDNRRADTSPEYAFASAATKIVPLVGAKSPQKALELARRVNDSSYGNRQKWDALASAARFQNPETAAKLWREIVSGADAQSAPRYAARAFELDAKLGRELFALARQKVETESQNEWQSREIWGGFGFYFARADASQARFLIEREWGLARQKKTDSDQLGALALAMAALDGPRAWQMAREVPTDESFASFEARRRIGLFLAASEEKRRDFPFSRQNWEEWREIEEE